ncbi:MAG TPA: guanosine monophosphate reductase [Ignavibacteria bacterium]|nr:guanosine monophosphate reductase [Ignavibacteria bacterium]HMR39092.1 guanosine monophosphate reductase [Ignavibacteria bacterium]
MQKSISEKPVLSVNGSGAGFKKISDTYSFTYDDISLLPNQISGIRHRSECDTSVDFLGIRLDLPVIGSPMNTVVGGRMARALSELSCLGIVHRFNSIEEQIKEFSDNEMSDSEFKSAAIGINKETDIERLKKLADFGIKIICVDIANGGSGMIEEFLNSINNLISEYDLKIIAGNVASYETTEFLINAEVHSIRVGIGNGAMCSTSVKSGIGIGQVDAIIRALEARENLNSNVRIIADGGINTPGAMCKALALGCDAVMFGRVLAGTEESPGDVLKYNSQRWKKYCGSASFAVKQDKKNYIEGEESLVPYKGAVSKIIRDYKEGLQSSMSYLNSRTIAEFQNNASFVKLTSNSFNERKPQV